jgi:hypothetical protein
MVPATLIEDLSEVRERRNSMIHHADSATPKYVAAAATVSPRAHPFVKTVAVGENVSPTDAYLIYSADVLVAAGCLQFGCSSDSWIHSHGDRWLL